MTAHAIANGGQSDATRSRLAVAALLSLLVSAPIVLGGHPHIVSEVRDGNLDVGWLWAAPGALLLAVAVTLIEAIWRTVRRGYFSGRSLVQVGFALAFFGFVATGSWREYQVRQATPASAETLVALAKSRDARVRALVVEVAARRDGDGPRLWRLIRDGLDDADPIVRRAAFHAVEVRADVDIGDDDTVGQDRARAIAAEGAESDGS